MGYSAPFCLDFSFSTNPTRSKIIKSSVSFVSLTFPQDDVLGRRLHRKCIDNSLQFFLQRSPRDNPRRWGVGGEGEGEGEGHPVYAVHVDKCIPWERIECMAV